MCRRAQPKHVGMMAVAGPAEHVRIASATMVSVAHQLAQENSVARTSAAEHAAPAKGLKCAAKMASAVAMIQ